MCKTCKILENEPLCITPVYYVMSHVLIMVFTSYLEAKRNHTAMLTHQVDKYCIYIHHIVTINAI